VEIGLPCSSIRSIHRPGPTRPKVRIAAVWATVFALFAIVFAASYSVLPAIDHRYRAVFYPGDRLADELARRFRAATGAPLVYDAATSPITRASSRAC